ncbi:hypothetical protein HOC13_03565 [Candidatus Woesearchaeota archaeon]|nr:hypothetical protein [Candidatus Woesearchaeota archaeon]
MPVFVKVDEYKDILSTMETIKAKMQDARNTIRKLGELKNEEDSQIQTWQSALVEIEKKIQFIDQSLHEPESV